MAITRSMVLIKKGVLEIGLYFLKTSGSRVGFLITGVTLAVLRVEETWPVNIDELMILVIGSTRTSRQSFSIHVGSGSSVQDFVDEFKS